MSEATQNSPAPAATTQTPTPTPANADGTLLGATPPATAVEMPAGFEGGADAWAKLDDAGKGAAATAATEKAKGESAVRVDAFAKAEGKDAKLAAYNALTKDEKTEAFKAMPDELKKELGVEDPAIPVYTDFKLPEGYAVDEKAMGEATALFKGAGLSQEQAQKFIDLAVSREQAVASHGLKAFVDLQNGWVSEIKADPQIGGDKLQASMALASRAIDRLGGDSLRAAMNLTGAGNNPAIFKAFVQLGQMLSEDKFAAGSPPPSNASRSPAQVIYGDSGPKQSADGA